VKTLQRSFLLLTVFILWVQVMHWVGTPLEANGSAIAGITRPSLAMQLARDHADVISLLGPGNTAQGVTNRKIVAELQYLDFPAIGVYWLLFVFVIGRTFRNWNLLRISVSICISAAAVLDVLENLGILSAVGVLREGLLWPHWFSVAKWLFFFLAMGFSALLFLRYPKLGSFGNADNRAIWAFSRLAGLLFIAAALTGLSGVAGSYFDHASLIVTASVFYAPGFLFFWLLLLVELLAARRESAISANAS
jgi:hypothetical protein